MSIFTTNPYGSYHDPNSKEFIQLNKGALIDFKPAKQFELLPSSADAFAAQLETISKQFSYYGLLKRVPCTKTIDPIDLSVTYGDFKNILE